MYDYICAVGVREPDILRRLREETEPMPQSGMQIGPDQGQFMATLVRAIGAKRTLDIGVFTGYSSLVVALALPEDGRVVACDVSEEFTSIARRYWTEAGVSHKIDLQLAPAQQTLDRLVSEGLAGSFDFAFIDADKPGYDAYYERCLTLLRPGGIILSDNVLSNGRLIDPDPANASAVALSAYNRMLHEDERVDIAFLSMGDGVSFATKR